MGLNLLEIVVRFVELVITYLIPYMFYGCNTSEEEENNHFSEKSCVAERMVNLLELPDVVLSLIATKLPRQKDVIKFGAVCRTLRSIYIDLQCQMSPRLPFLMLATDLNKDPDTRSYYSLTENRVCNSQVRIPHDRFCPGSSHGWIITVCENKQVSLFNPFDNNQIDLPPLTAFQSDESPFHVGFLRKAILSANPTYNPNYVVAAIYSACTRLAIVRPGDNAWTSVSFETGAFTDVLYFRDQLYAIDREGYIFSCDLDQPQPKLSKIAAPPPPTNYDHRYLVESSGELLQILRYVRFYSKKDHDVDVDNDSDIDEMDLSYYSSWFEVYKLDWIQLKWIELDRLDGLLIFIGDNASFSLKASDFPECKTNSIYFTDDYYEGYFKRENNGIGPHDMGVFSFNDRKLWNHYPTDSDMIYPAPIWVQPPP